MRFMKTPRRLELRVADDEVEATVLAIARAVVPHYSRKLYFLGWSERDYPALEQLAKQRTGFTIVRADAAPKNLLDSYRIVHDGSEIFVVPSVTRLPSDYWDRIIEQLDRV